MEVRVIQVVVVVDLVGERVARGPLGGSSRRRKSLQQRQVTAMDMVETIWPKFHLRATLLTGERSGLPRNPRLSSASFFSRKILEVFQHGHFTLAAGGLANTRSTYRRSLTERSN